MGTRSTGLRALSMALGGILVAGVVVAPGVLLSGLGQDEPRIVEYMTMGAYWAHRASHPEEDMSGWDCRIDGNMECGAPDTASYALSCTTYAVAETLCALERRPGISSPERRYGDR